jgi:hypothetical protein
VGNLLTFSAAIDVHVSVEPECVTKRRQRIGRVLCIGQNWRERNREDNHKDWKHGFQASRLVWEGLSGRWIANLPANVRGISRSCF